MIKKVIIPQPVTELVHVSKVSKDKVYFFYEGNDWFYLTSNMYQFRNLSQTDGYAGDRAGQFRTNIENMLTGKDSRTVYQANDMFEFVDFIRDENRPK